MRVAIIFGHNAPADGNGLVDLGEQIKRLGYAVDYFQESDEIDIPYDIYIGHSFGGDRAVNTIRKFSNYPVKYLALIDPVCRSWAFWNHYVLPLNIIQADCFRRLTLFPFPPSSQIKNVSASDAFTNFTFWMSHGSAPKKAEVRAQIISRLLK